MIISRSYFLFLISLFLCVPCIGEEDFYCFDVGQGSCHLVVYKERKIGFLFDAGSKNTKTLSKISNFQTKNQVSLFSLNELKPIELSMTMQTENLIASFGEVLASTFTPQKPTNISFMQSPSEQDFNTRLSSIREHIRQTISEHQLELLFIFLSHPDEDHINLIAKKYKNKITLEEEIQSIIPDELNGKVEAFLGGDWVNHNTEDTKTVLEYLKNINSNIHFPYYWKYEGTIDVNEPNFSYESGNNKYEALRKKILEGSSENLLKKENGPMFTNSKIFDTVNTYSPSLLDLILVLYEKNIDDIENKNLIEVLSRVFIRSIGASTQDVNSQSLIVSFEMPSLKSFITCTGDAENVTFGTVKNIPPNVNKNYLNAVIIPHHGAMSNFSDAMISILKPDLFFISAGLTSYDHPNLQLLILYEKAISKTSRFKEVYYHTTSHASTMSVARRGQTTKDYNLLSFQEVPVLCTNLVGNIHWSEGSINVSYSNIITSPEGDQYTIDLSKRLKEKSTHQEIDEETIQQLNTEKVIFEDYYNTNQNNKTGLLFTQLQNIPYYVHKKTKGLAFYRVSKIKSKEQKMEVE